MPDFKVGDTVDPRTLPVGAVFRHPSSYNRFVVEDASHCRGMISGAQFGLGDDPVVLLSLPSDPVELGTLARGAWFTFDESEIRWLDPDTKTSTGSDHVVDFDQHHEPLQGRTVSAALNKVPAPPTCESQPLTPPSCSSCKQPFWAGRPEKYLDLCGDCFGGGTIADADHLTNGLDTRVAEVDPEPADQRGAWQTPCDEGLS